jgi:hypothetical protein
LELKISIEEMKGVNIEKYVENKLHKNKNKWEKIKWKKSLPGFEPITLRS